MSANEPRGAPRRREPMFNAPAVVLGLIVVLLATHAALSLAPDAIPDRVIRDFAFIPGRLTIAIWPERLVDLLNRANSDPTALEQAQAIRELHVLSGGAKSWTLLTYAFLHGSWTHVLLNTVWLFAFGPPIARRFGSARFLLFMAVTAIAGALAQWASASMDFFPLIGASAALVERKGRARSFHVEGVKKGDLAPILRAHIQREAHLMTDEANQYTEVGKRFAAHGQVDHSREEYAYFDRQTKTIVSVNCAEGYFSIFKRGMVGIYQHCSEKHLHRYLASSISVTRTDQDPIR